MARRREICLPSPKRQKNIAQDATSLLERMYIPLLVYPGASGGPIKGRDGGAISIFINGVQANDIDLRTFWPKQCIRVEYFENPSDPRFSGHRNVVNFIMPVYEWGGILYYFGNFAVGGYFSTKQKNLLSDNTHVSRRENYELTFKYGNGNFTLSAELSDFLHTRRTDLRKLDMGIYSSHGRYWVTGRQLKISMTYTFDYGKKIQNRSIINAESDSKTSVIQ